MQYLYGIQPTGKIHLGNYLGGLKMAIDKKAHIMIADYHSMTTGEYNIQKFYDNLRKIGCRFITIQDKKAPELAWEIQCKTPMSDLKKMTQFKDKGEANVGLFTYPCLMAADIILSGVDAVIVGEDQLQHMEFYRKTCRRMGIKKIAKTILTDTPRIMSIKDPTKKMSKSLGDEHCLYIGEDNSKKIMKAPTTPEGLENLKQIARAIGAEYDDSFKKFKENIVKAFESLNIKKD